MNIAYYLLRSHPFFSEPSSGQVFSTISDLSIISMYFTDTSRISLVQKYFPSGLSPHGLSSFLKRRIDDPDFLEPITEIVFELVRQLHFPDSPSRLSSLYASQTLEDALLWQKTLLNNFNDSSQIAHSLWEIEFSTAAQLYDASLLNLNSKEEFSYLILLNNAFRYWKKEFTASPLPELLIPYPVTFSRKIRDFI